MKAVLIVSTAIALSMSAQAKEPTRYVENNILFSEQAPKMRITITNRLTYLGKKDYSHEVQDKKSKTNMLTQDFYFVEQDESHKLKAILVVSFQGFDSRTWVFNNNLLENADPGYFVEIGKMKPSSSVFRYATGYRQALDPDARAYLRGLGIRTELAMMRKYHEAMASMDYTKRIVIDYSEPVPMDDEHSGDWGKPNLYPDSQKRFASEFIDRANASFTITE